MSIAVIVVVVSTAAMFVRADLRQRAKARAIESSLVDGLRTAAAELGLTAPAACDEPPAKHSSAGKLHGLSAELRVGEHGWHQVVVRVRAGSLPGELAIARRGMEDLDLGFAGDAGEPRFDEHHALFGSRAAIKTHAAAIDRGLLSFVADVDDRHLASGDPSCALVLTATELRVGPGEPSLPSAGVLSLRWPCGAEDLVRAWRNAERMVKTGLDRRVFDQLE